MNRPRLYNGMIHKRPALIAYCEDVADVIAAVNFARTHKLTLAVHDGGHSGPVWEVAMMAWCSIYGA